MNSDFAMLLYQMAILFPAFLIIFTFRGFFRALVAKWMGDSTAQEEGFLTLNPLAHVDIVGMSVILFGMVILGWFFPGSISQSFFFILLIFGGVALGLRWTFPVPFDPRNFRSFRTGTVLTILAGPVGGFMGALFFMYIKAHFPAQLVSAEVFKSLNSIIDMVVDLAVFLGVIDLVPLPPFDGGRVLALLLPESKQDVMLWLEQYAPLILLGLFVIPGINAIFFGIIQLFCGLVIRILSLLVF